MSNHLTNGYTQRGFVEYRFGRSRFASCFSLAILDEKR
jgi:hypothetical protein